MEVTIFSGLQFKVPLNHCNKTLYQVWRHVCRSKRLVGHIIFLFRKQKVSKKWGWAIKSLGTDPSDSHPLMKLWKLNFCNLQINATCWESSIHSHLSQIGIGKVVMFMPEKEQSGAIEERWNKVFNNTA